LSDILDLDCISSNNFYFLTGDNYVGFKTLLAGIGFIVIESFLLNFFKIVVPYNDGLLIQIKIFTDFVINYKKKITKKIQ